MSQDEIIDFLKDNKDKWFSIKEIAEAIKIGEPSVSRGIVKLRQGGYIESKYVKTPNSILKNYYKYKEYHTLYMKMLEKYYMEVKQNG